MMRHRVRLLGVIVPLLIVLVGQVAAQHRDPLNEKEIDEMRETADLPDKRLN